MTTPIPSLVTQQVIEIIPNYQNSTLEEFVYPGNIPPGWEEFFNKDEVKAEIKKIGSELFELYKTTKIPIFPDMVNVFEVFYRVNINNMRVIIIGQDCYINGEAMGISFSIPLGTTFPPTLKNIFHELIDNGEMKEFPRTGDLTKWCDQGIFLINTALTVKAGSSGSHTHLWTNFTKILFNYLDDKTNAIIVAWGGPAQSFLKYFTKEKHPVLYSSHPSPLGYKKTNTPFYGCKHFSIINSILEKSGYKRIDFNL